MVENALVVAGHGLSDETLLRWFAEHSHECALCRALPGSDQEPDARLIELVLENDAEVAESRFLAAFPSVTVRRACNEDYALVPSDEADVSFELQLGSSPVTIALNSGSGGGTGAKCWPGGILLAQWLMRLHATESEDDTRCELRMKDVLEFGAGSAALPSIAAVKCGARRVMASDTVAHVVARMKRNLKQNAFDAEASTIDWQTAGREPCDHAGQFDVILFADCIYTERGAFFLADAVASLLRAPHGIVVGALPGSRAGIATFEEDLRWRGFAAREVVLDSALLAMASKPHCEGVAAGVVVGEPLEDYRIVVWHRGGDDQP